jgi:dihydrodipicolinate synthase/N-acetylneuraminate lyase
MSREELRQLIQGPVATLPTPFDDAFQVNHGQMAALTEYLVASGLVTGKAVLKVAAAMGEGPQLRDEEWGPLLRTVVQAAQGKAAIVCGIQYKDTVRAIEDAQRAQDLGAIGLQIAPPIFNDPTQDDILRYFEAISAAIEIGIIIYNTYWWPNGNILPETFHKMKDFEHVVAIKWGVPQGQDFDAMHDLVPIFTIIDNSNQPVRCHKLGGRGYISDTVDAYPPFDLKVWELMESHRYDEAQTLFDSVYKPLRGEFERKLYHQSGGQARLKKALLDVMGHPVGVSRPPSLPLSEEEMAELRELLLSFGWPVPG